MFYHYPLFSQAGEFVRTPKFGVVAKSTRWKRDVRKMRRAEKRIKLQPFVELAFGLYLLICLVMCLADRRVTIGVPFLCLFMVGYLYVPLTTWFGHRLGGETTAALADDLAPVPAPAPRAPAQTGNVPVNPTSPGNSERSQARASD